MWFRKKQGTFYQLIDNLIKDVNRTSDLKLKWKILTSLLEIRWTANYAKEAKIINEALESKGEKIRKAWEGYKEDLLVLEREKKDTSLVKAKLEVLNRLVE